MDNKLVLLGGGGHCAVVIDSIDRHMYERIVIVDKRQDVAEISGVPVVGDDLMLEALYQQGYRNAFISMSTIHQTNLYDTVKQLGYRFISIIDVSAVVSKSARIGEGVYIGKNAVVNADSVIGNCTIINSGAIVEHHCQIGNFSHIAPGAVLCGTVCVGDHTHIGAASCVRQNLSIGHNSIVGMGSVVTKNIPDHVTSYGNPCRTVSDNE